jgi:hypothetical protein
MLTQLLLQAALASGGGQGQHFIVSLEDVDQVLSGQTPTLWVLSPGEPSLKFALLDNGLGGDQVAEDGRFSGTVNELPPPPVRLVLQNGGAELWRAEDFRLTADVEYPALRLRLEAGEVTGGLKADLSQEALHALEAEGAPPPVIGPPSFDEFARSQSLPWVSLVFTFLGCVGLLVLLNGIFSFRFKINSRRWAIRRGRTQRGNEWALGEGLPTLQDGFQIWSSEQGGPELRRRILRGTQSCGTLFWVSPDGGEGFAQADVRCWSKASPSLGEALHWRKGLYDPFKPGPLFIEGLHSLYRGELDDRDLLEDLREMAKGPVVLLIGKRLLPEGWTAQALESLPAKGGDLPQA